jgi:hypothetical protein
MPSASSRRAITAPVETVIAVLGEILGNRRRAQLICARHHYFLRQLFPGHSFGNEFGSEVFEQLRIGGTLAGDKLFGVSTMPVPMFQRQIRLTITRSAIGC